MKTNFYILSISFLLLFNCGNKKTEKTEIEQQDSLKCKIFYKNYNKKIVLEENDSALYYINKAIDCSPKNYNYKNTKAMFLINIKKYNEAILQFNELSIITKDPAYKLFKGILLLKIGDKDSDNYLREVYSEYNKITKPTSSNEFYKIALDNYFKDKEYSLNEIKRLKIEYKNKAYELQNLSALEEYISNETKKNVMYKLINIKD